MFQVVMLVFAHLVASHRGSQHQTLIEISGHHLVLGNSSTVNGGEDEVHSSTVDCGEDEVINISIAEEEGSNAQLNSSTSPSHASRHGKPADADTDASDKFAKIDDKSIEAVTDNFAKADGRAQLGVEDFSHEVGSFVDDLKRALKSKEDGRCPASGHVAGYGCGMEAALKCSCRDPWYLPADAYYCFRPGLAQAKSSESMMRASVVGRCDLSWWLHLVLATFVGTILGCVVVGCRFALAGKQDKAVPVQKTRNDKLLFGDTFPSGRFSAGLTTCEASES